MAFRGSGGYVQALCCVAFISRLSCVVYLSLKIGHSHTLKIVHPRIIFKVHQCTVSPSSSDLELISIFPRGGLLKFLGLRYLVYVRRKKNSLYGESVTGGRACEHVSLSVLFHSRARLSRGIASKILSTWIRGVFGYFV